jgi:hypothetical protein
MSNLKRTTVLVVRLAVASAAMMGAYMLSTLVMGQTDVALTPEEASQAGTALVFVSLASALVLSFLIGRSPWRGWRLVGAVALVQFGVETFMSQVETLYFNRALQLEPGELVGLVAAGALRALIFAPIAALTFGKLKRSAWAEKPRATTAPDEWGKRIAALAVLYVVVYFAFGYFVAWQWEETRLFYSGTTEIKPFIVHFRDLFIREDPFIVPFQLLRGALWAALAILIVRMIDRRRWEASLAVAATFAVFLALPLGLFPNPFMPPDVARSHFVETASSMLLYGGIAGWVVRGRGVMNQVADVGARSGLGAVAGQ